MEETFRLVRIPVLDQQSSSDDSQTVCRHRDRNSGHSEQNSNHFPRLK